VVADARVRAWLRPGLVVLARGAGRLGLRHGHLTALGLLLGLAAAVAVAAHWWLLGGALWLLSRLPDGIDGVLARETDTVGDLGGYLDLVADFLAYGAFVVGVGVALPDARVACLVLLLAYYINGIAFLAMSAIAERRAQVIDPGERSLQFVGGLTEGFETILAHTVFAVVGAVAADRVVVAVWVFVGMVAVTVVQRVAFAVRVLREP
jgi:phosphatidylglycerophosphate synthase